MNSNIMVSVIIISYNEEKFLAEAVESCLSQSLKEIEIIIGDDGSSDNSIQVIKEYESKNKKITHFVMERNETSIEKIIPSIRVSNVIKRSLSLAKGKYIVCLSADDYFCDSNKLKEAVDFLESNADYSAFVSAYKKVWPDNTEKSFKCNMLPQIFWSGSYVHISAFVFRHEIYKNGEILERLCDDTGLIYSIACSGKWKYSDKTTFAYRQRGKSIMHEADMLELSILEVMIYQDIVNKGNLMRSATLSRYSKSLHNIFKNKKLLLDSKYEKYLKNSSNYNNDIFSTIIGYDNLSLAKRIKFKFFLANASLCRVAFYAIRNIFKILNK